MLSLKSTLLLNGVTSGATGIGLIVFANKVAELFAVQSTSAFIVTGIFFAAFASFVLYTALQKEIKAPLVKAVSFLDVSWVVISIVIAVSTWGSITFLGTAAIIIVAAWVGMMAYLQNRGVKLLHLSKASLKMLVGGLLMFSAINSSAQTTVQTNTNYETAINVVESFLDGVQQKKSAQVALAMDSLVVWNQPGSNRFSGIKRNSKEVFAMFGGMLKMTDRTLELTEYKIVAQNGNQVVCQLQWKAVQPGGTSLYVSNIDVYTVENNKITKVIIYTADVKQEDEFWGK